MNEIKSFINNLGQTLIGKFESETEQTITLKNIICIGIGQDPQGRPGINFGAISPFAKDEPGKGVTVTFYKITLIEFPLRDDIIAEYQKMIGDIQIAPASTLIALDNSRKK